MRYDPRKHGEAVIAPDLPEQVRDGGWLYRVRYGCDFSEPGAVKTMTALNAVERTGSKKVMVITSPISVRMWARNLAARLDTEVEIIDASRQVPKKGFDGAVIVTYAVGANAYKALHPWVQKQYRPDIAIADEVHRAKDLTAARTVALYGAGAARGKDALTANVEWMFSLTGSPILRYNDDVFTHFNALRPDLLASVGITSLLSFQSRFTRMDYKTFHPRQRPKLTSVGSINTDALSALMYEKGAAGLEPLAVRRFVTDLTKMPPITFDIVDIGYERTEDLAQAEDDLEEAEFEHEMSAAKSRMRRLLGIAKVSDAVAFIEEKHEARGPILVLYWHREVGADLKAHLSRRGKRVHMINGDTSTQARYEAEDAFNDGRCDYLIGQIGAMSESLNLQRLATTVVAVEEDWSPGNMDQAIRRLWRFGQKNHVFAFFLRTNHRSDLALTRNVEEKVKAATRVSGNSTRNE